MRYEAKASMCQSKPDVAPDASITLYVAQAR